MHLPNLITILLLLANSAFSQEYKGTISDSLTNETLPYVNIGIVGKNNGTVSDQNGHFNISLDKSYDLDTIKFSIIGYESKSSLVKDFKSNHKEMDFKLLLSTKITVLREVIVKPDDNKSLVLGNTPQSRFFSFGFEINNLGNEIGSLFKIPHSIIFIDSIQLNISKCNYDSLFLRLNVYKVNGNRMDNILTEPIYLNLTKKEAKRGPVIDLSKYAIFVDDDFLISVELVKYLGEKGFYFYARSPSEQYPVLYRGASQGDWKYVYRNLKTAGISILAYIH